MRLAIFKVGKYTSTSGDELDATPEYLQQVVDSYDPALHEAPAVIGHPKDNHPAYGWVKSLEFDKDDGVLYANLDQVEPQFAQLLKDGRFKKRSASFYPANSPVNPTPNKPYLRHVGFLGAQAPSLKGLPDANPADFSDSDTSPVFEFSEFQSSNPQPNPQPKKDTTMGDKDKTPNTDAATDEFTTGTAKPIQGVAVSLKADLDAREQALAEKEAAIAKREADYAKREADAKAQDFSEHVDGLIKTGQIVPSEKDALVSVMMDLDNTPKTFDFAEGGKVETKSSVDVLKNVLSRLAPTIDFNEHSSTDPNTAAKPQHGVDPSDNDDALHKEIQDYSDKHNMSFAEAAINF